MPTQRVALQMDPLESINPRTDTTLLLGVEAIRRGYEVYTYAPSQLSFKEGKAVARARKVDLRLADKDYFTAQPVAQVDLTEMQVILVRQDPPFDMAYLTTTYILETLKNKVKVVNDPFHIRNNPEKWLILQYPHLTVPTLISSDSYALQAFRKEHKNIVIKPLFGHGGYGVFHIRKDDPNFLSFLEFNFMRSNEPLVAQPFIKEVAQDEKRIVIIDGQIMPVMNRVPPEGEIRSNLRAGGIGKKIELTTKQRGRVEELLPALKERGFLLTGLDMIGDYITEINITSPTGLRWINAAYGVNCERVFWDAVEKMG